MRYDAGAEGAASEYERSSAAGASGGLSLSARNWPGREVGQRVAVDRLEHERAHRVALAVLVGHPERTQPGPGRRRRRPRQALVALGAARVLVEQRHERLPPTLRQRGDGQRPAQPRHRVAREVEQGADLAHRHGLGSDRDALDRVARAHVALLEDPEVVAGPVVRIEERGHARLLEAQADLVTRHPWLGDLEDGVADAVAVADADGVVGHALDGEVLAEVARGQVVAAELPRPVVVGRAVVDVHGAVLAAVGGQVGLAVAVDVEPAHAPPAVHRRLEDRRVDGPVTPLHVAREADVEREQPHGSPYVTASRATPPSGSARCSG